MNRLVLSSIAVKYAFRKRVFDRRLSWFDSRRLHSVRNPGGGVLPWLGHRLSCTAQRPPYRKGRFLAGPLSNLPQLFTIPARCSAPSENH